MRAFLPEFQMVQAKNVKQALGFLQKGFKPLAGGTDLMVLFAAGHLKISKFVNIWGIKELNFIKVRTNQIEIGALTTYTDIRDNAVLQKEFPNLCIAASLTGAIAIQNRGTIGGNIANASPAADSPPALLSYDAEIILISKKGKRKIKYSDFHLDYKKMHLEKGELVYSVVLPRVKNAKSYHHFYRKIGTRKAQSISKVCFSIFSKTKKNTFEELRIGLGSVAAVPLRCIKTEEILKSGKVDQALLDRAKEVFRKEISPISDIRSTKEYRNLVAVNVFERFVKDNVELG